MTQIGQIISLNLDLSKPIYGIDFVESDRASHPGGFSTFKICNELVNIMCFYEPLHVQPIDY